MNCNDAERLILAERDGPLPSAQENQLSAHLEGCASCRRVRLDLREGFAAWSQQTAAVAVPDAREAWNELRSARRTPRAPAPRPVVRWLQFGVPLAAAAMLAVMLVRPTAPVSDNAMARVQYVEPGSPGASTLVYEDRESGWLVIWTSDVESPAGL